MKFPQESSTQKDVIQPREKSYSAYEYRSSHEDLTQRHSKNPRSSTTVSTETSTGDRLADWMYWQRDIANKRCWTKVYAVIEAEFLQLHPCDRYFRNPLVQIAVASVKSTGTQQLQISDPNGEKLDLFLFYPERATLWSSRLHIAASLTLDYFEAFSIRACELSRTSAYRGSLITYREEEKKMRKREYITNKLMDLLGCKRRSHAT
uniref:Uncharacterized protein AlNc14C94G5801 n=1 Tax=Albugo laibachii Nc14 TaxID=890382 RepID=F0WGS4_9STRA|nr:conserved hypothetical protein [Albugo laibachii Nc14]|eukprot:CCA20438.1 conserved hypothetical protein [Albugo laibachii Nc14]